MRYQLRYAAGTYWLLDTWQEGVPYRKPLVMNEMGADIWRRMEQGCSPKQIVDVLSQEYQISREVVEQDVDQFQADLANYGIEVTQEYKLPDSSGKEGI